MNKVEVVLFCRHRVRVSFDRQDDDQAYCRFHGWQNISNVFGHELHMFCADCRMSRWYGQRLSTAKSAAERHEENNPHHRTFVTWDVVTRDGKGIARAETLREVASQAKLWDDGPSTVTDDATDVIPF